MLLKLTIFYLKPKPVLEKVTLLQTIYLPYIQWLRIKDVDNVPILLIGNKVDIRKIDIDCQARIAAQTMQIPYFETSARTRFNIDEIFFELVRMIRKNKYQYEIEHKESLSKTKLNCSSSHYCSCNIL